MIVRIQHSVRAMASDRIALSLRPKTVGVPAFHQTMGTDLTVYHFDRKIQRSPKM
jgi:hypothetical protein